jgi:3-keto-disaccharide hydrolase
MRKRPILASLITLAAATALAMQVVEYKSGIVWPEPPVIEPGQPEAPPSDAIVLLGQNLDAWQGGDRWSIEGGIATAAGGTITSKQKFGDCQLHVEFATPAEVKGSGQGRGNSGIYLMSRYEVQILDSYDNKTYFDGLCGAIYKEQPPTVNACRKPGEWQTYDILFTAPRFDDGGSVIKPGYVTVLHNGVLIHNHFELLGVTSYTEPPKYATHGEKEPLQIQFHGNPVRFRNIWIRENVNPLIGLNPDPRPNSVPKTDF